MQTPILPGQPAITPQPLHRWTRLGLSLSLSLALGLTTVVFLTGLAQAANIIVNTNTDAGGPGCELREAIQAANSDTPLGGCNGGSGTDTITFDPSLAGQTITLTLGALNPTTDMTIDSSTTPDLAISGGGVGRVFNISGGNITLVNLIVTGGNAGSDVGGGIFVQNSTSELILVNVSVLTNTATSGGGGVYANGSTSVIGGLFQGNFCSAIGCSGGGLFAAGPLLLSGVVFQKNSCVGSITGGGGGLFVAGPASLTGSLFDGNNAGVNGRGGGLYATSALTLSNVQFLNNTTSGNGSGGGLYADGPATVVGGLFHNNSAGNGGGLVAANSLAVNTTRFLSNTAVSGGGLSYLGNNGRLVNSLLARNTIVSGGSGAGILVNATGIITIVHTTIASPTSASGAAIRVDNGIVGITNTLIASHTIGIERSGGAVSQNYNLFFGVSTPVSGTVASGGNSLSGVVTFINLPSDDYRLQTGSAAIDTGVNAGILVDFEGQMRPKGSGFDIGYDEVPLIVYLPIIHKESLVESLP